MPMHAAPAMPAVVPARLTPPDVPAGTNRPERMERGDPGESVPTSVDHVSAADVAIAPIPSGIHAGPGAITDPTAAATNTPPLATTCHPSRRPSFVEIGKNRIAFIPPLYRESALAVKNIATSSVAQDQPAMDASAPAMIATTIPEKERDARR